MNVPVKTVETNKDKNKGSHLFDYLAVAMVIAGVVLFYTLNINIWLKWGIVLFSVLLAFIIFFKISPTGLKLHGYVLGSWRELGKVAWPSRKEAMQFTWIVFLFVLLFGILLWIIDSSLAWLFYGVILGRGN